MGLGLVKDSMSRLGAFGGVLRGTMGRLLGPGAAPKFGDAGFRIPKP